MWNCWHWVFPHGMVEQPSLPVCCAFAVAWVHPLSHPWEPCMRAHWMLRFTKEGAALVQPQSRAGLCTVPLSSAIAVGWSECLLGCFSQDKLMCIFTDLPCSTCSGAPPGASAPTEEAGPEFSFWRNRLCDCFPYSFRKQKGQNNPQYWKYSIVHGFCCLFLACCLLVRKTRRVCHPRQQMKAPWLC